MQVARDRLGLKVNPEAALELSIEFDRKMDAEAVVTRFCHCDRYDHVTMRPNGWPRDGRATLDDLTRFEAKVMLWLYKLESEGRAILKKKMHSTNLLRLG